MPDKNHELDWKDVTHIFAVPGENHIIDNVHPATGRSIINGQTLDEIRQRYPKAELILWEDWRQEQIKRQDTPIRWTPVTERQYQNMLEILPPAYWNDRGFLVGEPDDHSYRTGAPRFRAYIASFGKHYVSNRPLTIKEYKELTW